ALLRRRTGQRPAGAALRAGRLGRLLLLSHLSGKPPQPAQDPGAARLAAGGHPAPEEPRENPVIPAPQKIVRSRATISVRKSAATATRRRLRKSSCTTVQ